MTSKELTELIHQNTRIILPEFGAFLVKDSGDKGFNPANVSFSPFLRYNDGMLEVYVAKKLVISKDEASKVVREFVESIKNELLEKGFFEVEGLGELRRDQRGSLSFSLLRPEEIQKGSIKIDTTKEETSPIPSPILEKSDDQSDAWLIKDKPIEESAEDKKPRKITGEKAKVEKLTTSKKLKKTSIVVEEPQMNPIETIESDSTLEIESIGDSDFTQPNQELVIETPIEAKSDEKEVVIQLEYTNTPILEIENTSKEVHEPIRKGRFTGLVYTAIAIIVAVILFFVVRSYYFPPNIESVKDNQTIASEPNTIINEKVDAKEKVDKPKDEIDKAFNEEPKENKPSKEQLKKEKEQEDAIANTLIKNAQANKIETKTSSGIKFYIIAGSFKNPDFANKFVNELKKSGYDASIVIQPSGMNAVHIGSYSSHEEANKALKEFKSKLPNLWILKK